MSIESQTPIRSDSGDSWLEKVKRAGERSGILSDEEPAQIETRGRKKKTAATDEFSTLLVSVLVLMLSFSSIPDDVKPNNDELNVFSKHLSSILLRHLPISNKFSQDSLDVIGLIAILSGWYARVAPAIKTHQIQAPAASAPQLKQQPKETQPPARIDPIEKINPNVSSFLDAVERKAASNAES